MWSMALLAPPLFCARSRARKAPGGRCRLPRMRLRWPRSPRWRKVAWIAAGVVVVGAGGFFGWMELVKAGILRYNKYDRRERGSLRVGAPAPDLTLPRYEGGELKLSELWRERPVVLVFGSCT